MMDSEAIARKYDKILAPMTRAEWKFWATVIPLAAIFLWSFYAFGWQYRWGLGETGMGHPVSWAFYLVNFVFFIGISQTIARQLGGGVGRLSATIGAHSFSGGRDSVQFRFRARARNGSNSVRIVLEPSDTYRVEFWSIRGASAKLKKAFDDVYADSLRGLFENETGLYLSL